jgi:hypothetical protein
MATFDLKKQLTIHDRGLLRQLLGGEPSMQAIDWDAMPRNNIAPLTAAWEAMDEVKKRHYQVILQDVQHLAEPKGLKVLIEELEWRHPDKLPLFAAQLGTADKSLWAFLNATEAFDEAAIFARAEALRNGQQANIWNSLPKEPIVITQDKLHTLEQQIRAYYWNREMRGEVCKVNQYDRHDGSQYFFAYLPDWPDKRLCFDEQEQLTPREDVYAFSNAFVFEPSLGTIELIAKGGKKVQKELRRAFCQSMLGIEVDDEDPLKPVYCLDQLLDSSFAFTTEANERIADVRLRRVRIVPRVTVPSVEQFEFKFREATDLPSIRSVLAEQLASMQLGFDQVRVTQAGIQFQFMGNGDRKGKTMMVNVSCPNTCDLKSKPEEQELIGRACFVRWGIINA